MDITAVILAAGQGSRMNDHNRAHFSKAMVDVLGKPLITFIIDALVETGIRKILIVKKADDLSIESISKYYSTVTFTFINDTFCNGSLTSFLLIRDYVQYPFVLADCDIICEKHDFSHMIHDALCRRNESSDIFGFVSVIDSPIDQSIKMLETDGTLAKKFIKKGIVNGVCGGMVYIFLQDPFKIAKDIHDQHIFSYATYFNALLSEKKIYTMHIKQMWDINTVEGIKMTEKIFMGDRTCRE